jgi:uncharacterized protein
VRDSFFQQCMERNTAKEVERKFCKHNIQHMIDVARITYILVLEHGDFRDFIREHRLISRQAAKEVIYASGMLHDIGRWREYETGEDHAAVGADYAREVLARNDFSPTEIKIITVAIREHRVAGENMSFLGERLYRADNLARACSQCDVRHLCYKFNEMETGAQLLIY